MPLGQTAQFSSVKAEKLPDPVVINMFGGIDNRADSTQIAYNRADEMSNYRIDKDGKLRKWEGYTQLVDSVDTGFGGTGNEHTPIRCFSYNPTADVFVYAKYTSLYTIDTALISAPTEIYDALTSAYSSKELKTFFMNDIQYFLDGDVFLSWDGVGSVAKVQDTAYIPTMWMGTPMGATGGGVSYEEWNLIGTKFTQKFSTDVTNKVFQLNILDLDDGVPVVVVLNGTTLNGLSDYTFDYATATGELTDLTDAGTDNLWVTVSKVRSEDGVDFRDEINKCTIFTLFGGENDTRVFLSGNGIYPNVDYASGLFDPSYWPENDFSTIGNNTNSITGYAKMGRTCVILKDDSTQDSTRYIRTYSIDSNGEALFAVEQGGSGVGCIDGNSIQIVEDRPLFAASDGIYRIASTNVKDETTIECISDLLGRDFKALCSELSFNGWPIHSFEYDGCYIVIFDDEGYVFDTKHKYTDVDGIVKYEVYKYVFNSSPFCFYYDGATMYFGTDSGEICSLNSTTNFLYNAGLVSVPVQARWASKVFSMDADNYKKTIDAVHLVMPREDSTNEISVYYKTDKKDERFLKTFSAFVFNFATVTFTDWSFEAFYLPKSVVKRIKQKKVIYFQLILTNASLNKISSVINLIIDFQYQSEVK